MSLAEDTSLAAALDARMEAANAMDEAKASIRAKALERGDYIDFFVVPNPANYEQIIAQNVMGLWQAICLVTKETKGVFLAGALFFVGMLVSSLYLTSLSLELFKTSNGDGGPWLLSFLSVSSVIIVIGMAWNTGLGNLVSIAFTGHTLNYQKAMSLAANTILGVGRDRLYFFEEVEAKRVVRSVECDAIGEIESVEFSVRKHGQKAVTTEVEFTIVDRFGRVGLSRKNFQADNGADVIAELKRRKDAAQ